MFNGLTHLLLYGKRAVCRFSYLGLNIERMFLTGKPQYPVERTLLVTGALDALMRSRHNGHERALTPHLCFEYVAPSGDDLPRPRNPRAIGASTVQSDEWLKDYPKEFGGTQIAGFFGRPTPHRL